MRVPDREARLSILRIHSRGMPLAGDVSLESLADRTQRFTGADLENLMRRAGLEALRADPEATVVTAELVERALEESHPSVTPEMEEDYKRIAAQLKQERPMSQPIGFAVGGNQ